ncbi:MAG: AraC family transcriptional regulator [Dorea sp.]|jgi:AraC-like DNA-binding protein|nr:AraC family transcriptional regulator [Dorea sp.]
MIRNPNVLTIDLDGKELQEQNVQLLNLTANHGDIHQYVADCIPAHWHRELEVFILLEGSVRIQTGEQVCQADAGEGCFINTGVLHSFTGTTSSPCIFRSFVFDPSIVGGAPGSVFDTATVRPVLESGPSFLKFGKTLEDEPYFRWFRQAFHACKDELPGYEFKVREALSEILLFVKDKSRLLPPRTMPAVPETRVKQMLEYIDANLGKTITVKDIAASASVCPRECQRIFSRYLHYRPMEFVQQRRIFAAASLLSGTDLSITEIALNCGFQSPGYFSRQFKLMTGRTPRDYRSLSG